jgi:hypothetical protein
MNSNGVASDQSNSPLAAVRTSSDDSAKAVIPSKPSVLLPMMNVTEQHLC